MLFSQYNSKSCPVCKSVNYDIKDSKLLGITKLIECKNCKLRYRIPKDSEKYNFKFYQSNYEEKGLTTDLPNKEYLNKLIDKNFSNTEKDRSFLIPILKSISHRLKRKISILDYGANWGYFAYQFKKLEFVNDVKCFELSKKRREFGEQKLGIKYIENNLNQNLKFDLFFSSHVIEHMHNPLFLKKFADQYLKEDGILFLTCPNGSDQARKNKKWKSSWGEVHPNFITDDFICRHFKNYRGCVFDAKNLNNTESVISYCDENLYSEKPESTSLWFIGQKNKSA